MPTQLADTADPTSILYAGPAGTGKTTAAVAMAKLGKVWVANAEAGLKKRALEQHGIPIKNIEIYPDPDDPDESISYEGLESEWKRIREALNKKPGSYVGCVWDSGTEIQQKLLDVLMRQSVLAASRAGRERNPWQASQDNRTETNAQIIQLSRWFRDLPCHFAITTGIRREQDDDGTVIYQPGVTPGVQEALKLHMDLICITSVGSVNGEEEFRGLFRPDGKYQGKDRLNALPKWLIDPQFDRVQAYIDGTLDRDSDPVMEAARVAREQEAAKLAELETAAVA
jgi:hypothetical protein